MNSMFIGTLFTGVWLVLAVPALILLMRSYSRTRMTGFIWLAVALTGWPLVSRLTSVALPVIAGTMGVGIGTSLFGIAGLNYFLALSLVETLIGGVLLIFALFTLDRELAARTPNQQVPPPPSQR